MSDGTSGAGDLTRLFSRWRAGDEDVAEQLLPQVYRELRGLAGSYLRRESRSHTLQPTELVNEAFLRLLGSEAHPNDRSHFFALAARAMRRILVDHARRKRAAKRFDSNDLVTLETDFTPLAQQEVDVLDLNDALERLSVIAPRPAQLVELRFFAGLTNREVTKVLDISLATAERDWKTARIWLRRELQA